MTRLTMVHGTLLAMVVLNAYWIFSQMHTQSLKVCSPTHWRSAARHTALAACP
jgi:hypothetical protein